MITSRIVTGVSLVAAFALSACGSTSTSPPIPSAGKTAQAIKILVGTAETIFPASAQVRQTPAGPVVTYNGRSVTFGPTAAVSTVQVPSGYGLQAPQNARTPQINQVMICDCDGGGSKSTAQPKTTVTGVVTGMSQDPNSGDLTIDFGLGPNGYGDVYVDGRYYDTLYGPANGTASLTIGNYSTGSPIDSVIKNGGTIIGTGHFQP
jgi:hypothetical protein